MTTDRELADELQKFQDELRDPKNYHTQSKNAIRFDRGDWLEEHAEQIIAALRRSQPDDERAYQMLEAYGVPRERAKSVANGIDVLGTRFGKEIVGLRAALTAAEAEGRKP